MAQKKTNVEALRSEMEVIQNKLKSLKIQRQQLTLKHERLTKALSDTDAKASKLSHRLEEIQKRLNS